MNRLCSGILVGALMVALGGAAQAGDDVYTLGFQDPNPPIVGNPGETVSSTVLSTLLHEGSGAGAQGFSISVAADGASITSITFAGSDTEDVFSGGFSQGGVTMGKGNEGAVIAVVLCFGCPNVLPDEATIAAIGVDCTLGKETHTATMRYIDGLQGPGQPVDNIITQLGQSFTPIVVDNEFECQVIQSCCDDPLNWGFSADNVESTSVWDGVLGDTDDVCGADGGEIIAETQEGEMGVATAYLNIVSQLSENGVQGWSAGVLLTDAGATVADATIDGTAGGALINDGFEATAVIDPDDNGGQEGAVTAVILCFGCEDTLPLTSTTSVLKLDVQAGAPQGEADQVASLSLTDGLVGPGQPVRAVITREGESLRGCNGDTASVDLVYRLQPLTDFIRGDANDDGKVNIADGVWIANNLFYKGPDSPCADAADANDNGIVELADTIFIIAYRFQGGPPPTDPFPDCGFDPSDLVDDGDGLPCENSSCP